MVCNSDRICSCLPSLQIINDWVNEKLQLSSPISLSFVAASRQQEQKMHEIKDLGMLEAICNREKETAASSGVIAESAAFDAGDMATRPA